MLSRRSGMNAYAVVKDVNVSLPSLFTCALEHQILVCGPGNMCNLKLKIKNNTSEEWCVYRFSGHYVTQL